MKNELSFHIVPMAIKANTISNSYQIYSTTSIVLLSSSTCSLVKTNKTKAMQNNSSEKFSALLNHKVMTDYFSLPDLRVSKTCTKDGDARHST